jgi:hypothetical protein
LSIKFADEDVPPDLIDNLRSGHRQLWVAWDGSKVLAAAITRINVQRSGLACQIAACGGTEGERWMHLISRIEDWARAEGCRKVVIEGRPGWERVFPAYKRVRVVLEREL